MDFRVSDTKAIIKDPVRPKGIAVPIPLDLDNHGFFLNYFFLPFFLAVFNLSSLLLEAKGFVARFHSNRSTTIKRLMENS